MSYIIEEKTYKPEAIKALRAFKKKKTFKLSVEERIQAMDELLQSLAQAYTFEKPITLKAENMVGGFSGASHVKKYADRFEIFLVGKASIITLLHEFAHCRGYDEHECKVWSLNLFRKVYPKQFEKLVITEHGMAVKQGEENSIPDSRTGLLRLFGIQFSED